MKSSNSKLDKKNINVSRPLWEENNELHTYKYRLDKNEVFLKESLKFNEYIISQLKPIDLATYPDLSFSYSILEKIFNISQNNTLLVNGADGGIRSSFVYLSNHFTSIILDPTFAMINVYPSNLVRNLVKIPYQLNGVSFSYDIDKLIYEVKKSTLAPFLVIASPDSPTGNLTTINDLTRIIEIIEQRSGRLLIDATYGLFCGVDYINQIIDLSKIYESVLVVTSLSKFPGLAGTRLGFITGNNILIDQLRAIRPMYEIGALQSKVLEITFSNWETCLGIVRKMKDNKSNLEKLLKHNSYTVLNTFGNFTLFKSDTKIQTILDNVCLYRKTFNNPCLKSFSRLSTPPEEFIQKLKEELKKL